MQLSPFLHSYVRPTPLDAINRPRVQNIYTFGDIGFSGGSAAGSVMGPPLAAMNRPITLYNDAMVVDSCAWNFGVALPLRQT
jgi:hypothetical protein